MEKSNENYMRMAISQAKKCKKYGDVPVGAVIVKDGKVLARAYNQKEKKQCSTCHAEILAINKASAVTGSFILSDCDIYITKEPCLMCMGAILSARINCIVFGARDKRFGTQNLATENNFNHKCKIVGGVLEDECGKMLTDFFKNLRGKNAST